MSLKASERNNTKRRKRLVDLTWDISKLVGGDTRQVSFETMYSNVFYPTTYATPDRFHEVRSAVEMGLSEGASELEVATYRGSASAEAGFMLRTSPRYLGDIVELGTRRLLQRDELRAMARRVWAAHVARMQSAIVNVLVDGGLPSEIGCHIAAAALT